MTSGITGRRGVPLGVGIRHDGKPDSSQRSVDAVLKELDKLQGIEQIGNVRFTNKNITAGYNDVIAVETPGRAVTVNLPSAAKAKGGDQVYIIKACNDYIQEVRIDAVSGETAMGDDRILLGGAWNYVRLMAIPGIRAWACVGGDRDGRWTDERGAAGTRTNPASQPPSSYRGYEFAKNPFPNQVLDFTTQLRHGYWPSTEIFPHVHWAPGAAWVGGGVRWSVDLIFGGVGSSTAAGSLLNFIGTSAGGETPEDIYVVPLYLNGVSPTGLYNADAEESWLITGTVDRANYGDAGVAYFMEIDFHIRTQKRGTTFMFPGSET